MKTTKLMLEYTKALTILYIEDDITLLHSTKELFNNYFKHVDSAVDGEEGLNTYLRYYEKNGCFYDLVITDINMPRCNGIDMSSEILKKNTMQAIIITSAHNEVEFLQQAIDLGISGFVTKPIKNKQLVKVIHRTAQAVSDHQFVESHLGQIEDLNLKLEAQNLELQAKNEKLEKSLRMLDTVIHKEQLIHPVKEVSAVESNSENQEQIREQIEHLIKDDFYELQELLSEIDVAVIDIIHNINTIDDHSLSQLVTHFKKYASILSFYTFFNDLSQAILNFSVTLKVNPLPQKEESVKNIFMLLESFMYVLGTWHKDLASGDESKINAFDASIISDLHTITNMWTQKEDDSDAGDIDDIFDF